MSAGVLLMSYGSPESPEEMRAFLEEIFRPRAVREATVREFQERYRLFGGRSPLLEISQRQAEALARKTGLEVRVGMLHWHPFIRDAVKDLGEPIVGVPLAPQYSRFSAQKYLDALRAATRARVIPIRSWHRQRGFLEAWADRIHTGLRHHRPDAILFTAHSVPEEEGDPYPEQLRETIEGIRALLPEAIGEFAYQSASSAPLKWRGPDVDAKLKEMKAAGVEKVMAAPIGFVSDHAEVLYDLDHLHRASAEKLGMKLVRCESLNDHPLLIEALAEVVRGVL
jgi:ferrochelatase